MKKKINYVLGALCTLIFAANANAARYGMAGCGLGSMVFQKNDSTQILASTTNGTGMQTVGITFGTSNCDQRGKLVSANYVAANQDSLKKDIARGSGESLNGLSQILKCGDEAALADALQKNYGAIFPSENVNALQINDSIHTTIDANAQLKATCSASL